MSKDLTITELESWIPLLEMFSDKHSVLQGAAGEDAMNVGDILEIIRSHIVCRAVTNLCCKKDRMPTEARPRIENEIVAVAMKRYHIWRDEHPEGPIPPSQEGGIRHQAGYDLIMLCAEYDRQQAEAALSPLAAHEEGDFRPCVSTCDEPARCEHAGECFKRTSMGCEPQGDR